MTWLKSQCHSDTILTLRGLRLVLMDRRCLVRMTRKKPVVTTSKTMIRSGSSAMCHVQLPILACPANLAAELRQITLGVVLTRMGFAAWAVAFAALVACGAT